MSGGRPLKKYRVRIIKASLLLYIDGEYVGCIPLKIVSELIRGGLGIGKPGVLGNPEYINKRATKEGIGKQDSDSAGYPGPRGDYGV